GSARARRLASLLQWRLAGSGDARSPESPSGTSSGTHVQRFDQRHTLVGYDYGLEPAPGGLRTESMLPQSSRGGRMACRALLFTHPLAGGGGAARGRNLPCPETAPRHRPQRGRPAPPRLRAQPVLLGPSLRRPRWINRISLR